MSSVDVSKTIHKVLDRISKENEFSDYSIVIKPSAVSGFGSDMVCIEIKENERSKKMNILCKLEPTDEYRRKECNSRIIFKREALFYNWIMPIFAKFQDEKNLPEEDQFRSFPKCYATVIGNDAESYAILMEDLQPHNFKAWNKPNSVPIEHLRLSMRELGKFHGISFALKDQRPEQFAEFKQLSDTLRTFVQSESAQRLFNNSFDLAIKSLKNHQYRDIIRDVKTNLLPYLEDCVNNDTTDRYGVISHGDYHNNNILFRLNQSGEAEDIRIVDWQSIRYGSPVLDILHSIFPSTEKTLRDCELDNLLMLYHSSLSKTIKLLGSNPDELFSLKDMNDELNKCRNFALLMAPLLVQVYQTDLMSTAKEKTFDKINTDFNDADQTGYDQRINDVIDDIVSFGYGLKN